MNRIYFDHQATTPTSKEVLNEMLPFFTDIYGNGSSQHYHGREAGKYIDIARRQVADAIGCKAGEVYFTSGGTESDNWAIRGVLDGYKDKGKHIITTCIEHPAMIKTLESLQKKGLADVTFLPVDNEGFISIEDLKSAIRPDTVLISVMTANNEIGTIQDIKTIGKIAKENNIIFHTDSVQAIGNVKIDVKEMNIDLLSMSAHKFYGPKGVGALYRRNGIKMGSFMTGGEQERNMRAGTLNTPGIVGLGKAIEIATRDIDKNNKYVSELRNYFIKEVESKIDNVYYNGTKSDKCLPSNANFSFEFIEGESLLLRLDLAGISVSSGSACSSGSLEPSYVLLATGRAIELAHSSLRFSFGKNNTKEEIDYCIENLVKIVQDLRELSPLFLKKKGENKYV